MILSINIDLICLCYLKLKTHNFCQILLFSFLSILNLKNRFVSSNLSYLIILFCQANFENHFIDTIIVFLII
jgi:hypothetical protein